MPWQQILRKCPRIWLHQILLGLRGPLTKDQDSFYDDGIYRNVIWSVKIFVIKQRKPYNFFYAIMYWTGLDLSMFFCIWHRGSGLGSHFLPSFSGAGSMLCCLGCKYCSEYLNTNKMSHWLNVRVQFASWNSEKGARDLGSMPSCSTDIQGDLEVGTI